MLAGWSVEWESHLLAHIYAHHVVGGWASQSHTLTHSFTLFREHVCVVGGLCVFEMYIVISIFDNSFGSCDPAQHGWQVSCCSGWDPFHYEAQRVYMGVYFTPLLYQAFGWDTWTIVLPGWSCQWYMLVSKTKPCKSKYKLFWGRNCEWLGKTAIISSMMSLLTDNRSNSRANTCWGG